MLRVAAVRRLTAVVLWEGAYWCLGTCMTVGGVGCVTVGGLGLGGCLVLAECGDA